MEKPKRILVVCTGNSCRSVMAKGLLKTMLADRDIQILSAGTVAIPGLRPTRETIDVMARHGVDVSQHLTQRLTPEMVRGADLVLVMEERHKKDILSWDPGQKPKVFLLREFADHGSTKEIEIPDPIAKSMDVYEKCFQMIKECVEKVVQKL